MTIGQPREILSSALSTRLGWIRRTISPSSRGQRLAVILSLLVGLGLSSILFAVAVAWEDDRDRANFQYESSILARGFQMGLAADRQILKSVGALFAGTEDGHVDRNEFHAFVAGAVSRNPRIQSLGWVPHVVNSQRGQFEQEAQKDGYTRFQFEERDAKGRPVRAPDRSEYFPAYFVEGSGGDAAPLGFNLASSPLLMDAMREARDTGKAIATPATAVMNEGGEPDGFLVFLPVYAGSASPNTVEERQSSLRGFALAIYRVDDLIHGSMGTTDNPIRLYDESQPSGPLLMYASTPDSKGASGPRFQDDFDVDIWGRHWNLAIGSRSEEHVAELFSGPAILLAAGLVLTLTMTAYVHSAMGRADKLFHANAALETEVAERRRAEKELHRVNRALRAASGSNDALVRATDEQELLEAICRVAVEIGGYSIAWVGFAEENEERSVRPVARVGEPTGDSASTRVSWGDNEWGRGPTGTAIRLGEIQVYRHVLADPRTSAWRHDLSSRGIASMISLPLMDEGRAFGALTIGARDSGAFDADEVSLLAELASAMAYGILAIRSERGRKEADARLRESLERLRTTMSGMIQAIGVTTELRDPYTAGHQRRVSKLAGAIAIAMGLPDAEIDEVRIAGQIHDIGKISVPAELLTKPGRLNEVEFAILKDHSRCGYEILKEIDFPWRIADIVLQHHEMLDGTGYPNGLSGAEIIRGARIIAVADVVEAMTSHRPYRPSRGLESALAQIASQKGIRYDAEVVDACLRVFSEGSFTFE